MRVFKFLVILSLCFGFSASLSDEMRMVVDVIHSYAQPTAVVSNVCWRLPEKFSFLAHLTKSEKATTTQFVSDPKDVNKFDPLNTLIIVDVKCPGSRSFLAQADKDDMFNKPYRWIIIENMNEFRNFLTTTNLKVLPNSEVAVAQKTNNYTFELNLIYRIDMNSGFISEEFGIWSAVDGFKIFEVVTKTSMAIRRKNLNGKPIAASYVTTYNSSRTKIHLIDEDWEKDSIAKVTYHNIIPLYDFINATKVMVFTDTWGYYVNNTWNGMVGDIVNGKAELCGTISFMSLTRAHAIQFITQPVLIQPKFLFRDPPLSFQNNLFVLPFRGSVWMCIGGLIIILVVITYINAIWEETKIEKTEDDPRMLKPNASDIGMLVISAITQQGSTNDLRGSLGRLVIFLTFLIFLFLYMSYAANIVALLQSNSNQIRTLADMLNSRLEFGVEDVPYNRHYFPTATEPVRKAIYETRVLKSGYKPNFMSLQEGVRRLRNKDAPFAFHMHLGTGYRVVEQLFHEHEKCDLHEISYYSNAIAWNCAKKSSPYRELYKIGIQRILEHGLGNRFQRLFYLRKPSCNARGGSFASVNMVDFHPVLLLMLYGMVLSVCLLLLEILMHRRQRLEGVNVEKTG